MPRNAKGSSELPGLEQICGAVATWWPYSCKSQSSPRPNPRAPLHKAEGTLSRYASPSLVSPKGQPKAKHHGDDPWHSAERRTCPEWCHTGDHRGSRKSGKDRWLAPRLCPHGSLLSGSHYQISTKGVDNRRLPPVVKSCLPCSIKGWVHWPGPADCQSSGWGDRGRAANVGKCASSEKGNPEKACGLQTPRPGKGAQRVPPQGVLHPSTERKTTEPLRRLQHWNALGIHAQRLTAVQRRPTEQ